METSKSIWKVHAERVAAAADIVDAYCREQDRPDVATVDSGSMRSISATIPPSAPQHVLVAQQTVLDSASQLQQLAIGPAGYLPHLGLQYQYLACIRWLCHFSIPAAVPEQGSISYAQVATAAQVPASQLRRIATMAITGGFLREASPGMLAHNATSILFRQRQGLVDWTLLLSELSAPTAQKMVEVTEKYGETSSKTETAFNLQHNTTLPYFDYFGQFPMWRSRFASYMKTVGSSPGTDIKHLINGFDWAALGDASVVDVGGSSGHASVALATAFPLLKFTVQDLPATIANAGDAQPKSLQPRIKFQSHDFFQPQVITDASVYLLRMILHDWPDAEARRIIQNHGEVLRRGARLVIMDTVLPTPGSVPNHEESLLRYRDLTMMQMFNSKERELSDWVALVDGVQVQGGKLVLKEVRKPLGSVMSVMEVRYQPDEVVHVSVEGLPTTMASDLVVGA